MSATDIRQTNKMRTIAFFFENALETQISREQRETSEFSIP